MSVPVPPVKLEGHCSVIHNNTLYVYSPEAFLSLPLALHGQWKKLSMGEAVTDAACVKGGVDGDNNQAALYVVGGTTSSGNYSGLQRYSFDTAKWETIETPSNVVQNRTRHGAAYLNGTSSILVYAGSQDGTANPTTSTFLISAFPPYEISSLPSQGALPSVSPMLLPWDDNTAALVGGDATSTEVFVFSPTGGWQNSGASVTQAIPDQVQCVLVRPSDGSKVLESFDMSTTPNTVTRVALLDAGGVPAPPGQQVGTASTSSAADQAPTKRKRDLTIAAYPEYNGTFAPKVTRSGFSLAQDGNGLVAISGGSDSDPLCLFDSSANRWLNATKLFHGDEAVQQPLVTGAPSSTSSVASSATAASSSAATSAATSTATGSPSATHSNRTATIIGATLGSILGFAALLIIALLVLRCLRQRKERADGKGKNGQTSDEKDRLSFQDQGMEPLTMAAVPMARGPVPSTDSWAIISSKVNGDRSLASPAVSQGYRDPLTEKSRSPLTTILSSRVEATPSPLSASDKLSPLSPTRSSVEGPPRGDRSTDEGWSKYFQDNNATNLVDMKSPRSTISSDQTKSDYRSSAWPNVASGVAPLNLGILDDPRPIGRVPTGSPSTEHAYSSRGLFVQQGQSARISSADSVSLISEDADYDRDAFSSGIPASVNDDPRWDRPPSSTYSNSFYPPSSVQGASVGPERSWIQSQRNDTGRANGRRSSTVIPEYYYDEPQSRTNVNSDMSWLNLGTNK